MKEKDIRDDEIRVIGEERRTKPKGWKWLLLLLAGITIGIIAGIILLKEFQIRQTHPSYEESVSTFDFDPMPAPKPSFFDEETDNKETKAMNEPLDKAPKTGSGFIEITDYTINDIPLRLYQPHNVTMSLHLGAIDENDPDILFAALAAAVREDNGEVLGEYVLKGERKAEGRSVKGFCAIINDSVTIGVSENSPLFKVAQNKGGYFFRQYPLVDNGKLVENNPKGKSVRRALCVRNGEIFTVETLSKESFHDFAQALVDLGVDNSIYLLGSTAYGWAVDEQGQRHVFGELNTKWENRNYLVMRKKS